MSELEPDKFFNREQRRNNMAKARSHMKSLAMEIGIYRKRAASKTKDAKQKLAQLHVDYYDTNKDLSGLELTSKFLTLLEDIKEVNRGSTWEK